MPKLGVVVLVCNLSSQELKAGGSEVDGQARGGGTRFG